MLKMKTLNLTSLKNVSLTSSGGTVVVRLADGDNEILLNGPDEIRRVANVLEWVISEGAPQ